MIDSTNHFGCHRDCVNRPERTRCRLRRHWWLRILGSQRVTEDVDLVIALTETMPSAEDLVNTLCQRKKFVTVDTFGVKTPAVKLDDSEFRVEVFDSNQWAAQYPHYSRVTQDRVRNTLPSGTTTYTFPATWLLREKI